jgi:hypothetical protein
MKIKKIVETTTDNRTYNRAIKIYRENRVIYCSYCAYHRGENQTSKWYGGYISEHVKYPNWKLVSKNRKQWMKKPLKREVDNINHRKEKYVTFKW